MFDLEAAFGAIGGDYDVSGPAVVRARVIDSGGRPDI
jgi:hypothetical protein